MRIGSARLALTLGLCLTLSAAPSAAGSGVRRLICFSGERQAPQVVSPGQQPGPVAGLRAMLRNAASGFGSRARSLVAQGCSTAQSSFNKALAFAHAGSTQLQARVQRFFERRRVWLSPDPVVAGYKTYADVDAFMNEIAAQNPSTTKKVPIGVNDQGTTIYGLQIGNGPVENLVVATHHGNEYGSTEVAAAFASEVAKRPIEGQTIFVVPVLNTPGFDKRMRYEPDGNGRYQDANRDYPGPCGPKGEGVGPCGSSQKAFALKSTRALADFCTSHKIACAATLHTYYPAAAYPWGLTAEGKDLVTPSEATFKEMAKDAAYYSKYPTGNSTDVIYAANGCFEDWAYWANGTHCMLVELGTSHSPSSSAVAEMIKTNVPGLRRMFERGPTAPAPEHDFTGTCSIRPDRPDPWPADLKRFRREHGRYRPNQPVEPDYPDQPVQPGYPER